MSKLVYLTGKARAGKDEFARLWIKHNPTFKKLAFADEIKKLTSKILGLKLEDLSNPETKEKYRAFIIFGGQLGRHIDPDIWIRRLMNTPEFAGDSIVSDVRFQNELDTLESLDGYPYHKKICPIRIKASEKNRLARGANPEFFDDISETDLDAYEDDDFEFTVENNSTLEDLERKVIEITHECNVKHQKLR